MTNETPETNERIARRIPEEVFAEGNFDLLDELYAEDAIEHNPFGDLRGRTAIRESYEGFVAAFPDITQKVEDIVAEGDTVAMRLTARGTHEGPMGALEPTGREIEVQQTVFTRIEDGEIVERWLHPDNLTMLQQLDVVDAELV
ncbi:MULTISPECIES: ester cyclase [unclassified Haladaptatus]|uniref:ester cyclase n=1 Tax=unclassified Haladaptatus TaxID=2622732 RepID=UPI00209BCAF7|nr:MULTISPECIES: ester cyclase [unclassified Haladaptatus]MCO8244546.1 ester cyclase [Haladaptatus sp. AB643]MCO8253832.1 ester cyclase [Haladaptatus sp. AB618]